MPRGKVALLSEPGDINQLLVPMASIFYLPSPTEITDIIDELPYMMGGRAAKPMQPVMWQDHQGVTMIPGMGVTEVAELQDMAYYLANKRNEDWRQRFGFAPRETFDTRMREHMEFRMKHPAQKLDQSEWMNNGRKSYPVS